MKIVLFYTKIFCFCYVLTSCQPPPSHPNSTPSDVIVSFEVYQGDTINRTDASGRKQGKWYIFSNGRTGKTSDTIFYKNGKEIKMN